MCVARTETCRHARRPACMHVCTDAGTRVHARTHARTHIHARARTYMHTHVHAHAHTHAHQTKVIAKLVQSRREIAKTCMPRRRVPPDHHIVCSMTPSIRTTRLCTCTRVRMHARLRASVHVCKHACRSACVATGLHARHAHTPPPRVCHG